MKSSMPTAGRHNENVTQWDDYRSDLPAAFRQGFHPDPRDKL
ncbi:MAG TPA: hypothetical protein VK957_04630 [Lunatimonas sp.]|nr:hypothetical protein [Lunatimonas sp.]